MKNWAIRWLTSTLALAVILYVIMGRVEQPVLILVTSVALGFVNSIIRPLIMLFAWPVNCLTFGLFGFVLNVVLFYAVVGSFIPGFKEKGPIFALIGAIGTGLISGFLNFVLADRKEK